MGGSDAESSIQALILSCLTVPERMDEQLLSPLMFGEAKKEGCSRCSALGGPLSEKNPACASLGTWPINEAQGRRLGAKPGLAPAPHLTQLSNEPTDAGMASLCGFRSLKSEMETGLSTGTYLRHFGKKKAARTSLLCTLLRRLHTTFHSESRVQLTHTHMHISLNTHDLGTHTLHTSRPTGCRMLQHIH